MIMRTADLKAHINNRETNLGHQFAYEFSVKTNQLLKQMENDQDTLEDKIEGGEVHDLVSELLDRSIAKKNRSDQEIEDDVSSLMRLAQELKDSFHSDSRFQTLQWALAAAIVFIVWVYCRVKATTKIRYN